METKNLKGFVSLALLCLLLSAGCTRNQGSKEALSIAGSTTVQPIAAKAAEKYMLKNPEVSVSVSGGGSGTGIKMASEGSADIGTSSRDLTVEEISAGGLKVYPIAADGIAVIVNPQNSLSDLTKQQIKDIFSGKIKNYKELGGPDKEIVAIIRESGSGTRSSFEEMIMDKGKTNNTESAEQQSSNGAVKASVAGNPNAIGYVGAGYIDPTVKAMKVQGIEATKDNIRSGTYPISRKLYMITKGEAFGKTKGFIDYVLSDNGQGIVEEEGFVRID